MGGGGGPAGGRAAAAARERRDAVDGGDADEAVDDAAGRVRRAELLAEDPGDEVELGDRDEPPVEPADDHERRGEQVELLHGVYLLYRCCTDTRSAP